MVRKPEVNPMEKREIMLSGLSLIGDQTGTRNGAAFHAVNQANAAELERVFYSATTEDIVFEVRKPRSHGSGQPPRDRRRSDQKRAAMIGGHDLLRKNGPETARSSQHEDHAGHGVGERIPDTGRGLARE